VRTARLSPGWLEAGRLCPLPRDGEGWWRSGDAALPLEAVLLLGLPDAEWGARLVALVRPGPEADAAALIRALETITARWWPAERPRRWLICPFLAPTAAGKWERARWRQWLQEAIRAGR
jgi:O-succinylbenzoic acid--CoA ligase